MILCVPRTGDSERIMAWLWHTLEEFSNQERKQFLGFVWGRERLPRDTSGLQLEVCVCV